MPPTGSRLAATIAPTRMLHHNGTLVIAVMIAGAALMGLEMVAPRLLAPFFGTSQPVWAVIIGVALLALAFGAWVGGFLADRWPDRRLLFRLLAWAGVVTALLPPIAQPVLAQAHSAIRALNLGVFSGALIAVLLLFALPLLLLATAVPFAVRLRLHEEPDGVALAGRVAGRLSALSTVGSLLGTFLTVLVFIPWIGTTRTIYLFAVVLVTFSAAVLRDSQALLLLLLVLALAWIVIPQTAGIRVAHCHECTIVTEVESLYQTIQVVHQPDIACAHDEPCPPVFLLVLNEGHALHSVYRTRFASSDNAIDLLTGGPWDYFAIAPFLYPDRDPSSIKRLALIGAGAGTIPKLFLATYGNDLHIDAVEIDGQIIDLARDYFAMEAQTSDAPNYHVHVADGRTWLAHSDTTYDIIGIDAYVQPYIPFHLTTVEFFREVQQHLHQDGVVVVNVARPPSGDDRLVDALATTIAAVFPQVFLIDTWSTNGHSSNVLVVGVNTPVGDGAENLRYNGATMPIPTLQTIIGWALVNGERPVRAFVPAPDHVPFSDDHAPVEWMTDAMMLSEIPRLLRTRTQEAP